ncbi:hypothetical protein PFLCHA0_c32050 [Pseudomonas protegens CHA0]|uniref:Uncharacterized protein n=1 Tax=Pseudomonas protegens (strain DSM 19095 / LMG 27888 / CFBP 6595 / CHA0) TaxID=1124983 RepID=A0A2C9EMV1_PSEPH|nr:hypothetical protein PFLCHA0_c32050 [Pseudomonas protegens CHA0]
MHASRASSPASRLLRAGGPVLAQQQSSGQSVLLQQHQPSNFC